MSGKKNRRNYDALLDEFEQVSKSLCEANGAHDQAREDIRAAEFACDRAQEVAFEALLRHDVIAEKLRAYALIFDYELPEGAVRSLLTVDTYKGEEDIPF